MAEPRLNSKTGKPNWERERRVSSKTNAQRGREFRARKRAETLRDKAEAIIDKGRDLPATQQEIDDALRYLYWKYVTEPDFPVKELVLLRNVLVDAGGVGDPDTYVQL